jgi:hypothetical protein
MRTRAISRQALIAAGAGLADVEAFFAFHRANPQVWVEFEKIALQLAASGAKRWGGMAVLNVIRFQRQIEKRGEFRVNNNHEPMYVRAFDILHPEHEGLFEKRRMKIAA